MLSFRVWSLERYARMTAPITSNDASITDQWEYFTSTTGKLELTLTSSDQILIHSGKRLLESISMDESKDSLRGICKGDSVLIIYKLQVETRRFRMKFQAMGQQSAEVTCREFVERLSSFFPLKVLADTENQQEGHDPSSQSTPTQSNSLQGDVTLAQLSRTITKSNSLRLPSTYSGCADMSTAGLSTMLKMSLSDSRFPAFVEQVERELEKIQQ